MWSEYHRNQARTLANLARLTSDPKTAASLARLATQHAEMAERAQDRKPAEVERDSPGVASSFAKRRTRG